MPPRAGVPRRTTCQAWQRGRRLEPPAADGKSARADPKSPLGRYNRGMRYPEDLLEGTFVSRLNRFAAMVDLDGKGVLAHVANSGRLEELFVPGAPVLLEAKEGAHRKSAFDLVLVKAGGAIVSADARLPPHLVREVFTQHRLPEFNDYAGCRREVVYEDSRLDLKQGGASLR